ncbi:hypothetical protein [Patulibacter sp. SYSU D01012]|uniref:hypothetical protein n=1 Tax=Patulibacter sp. SYSU D01012 TaxID=2817381 RepID=UPI001B3029A9|nr:hypothetical protein [Patulibacter sp. SYSU D01012]
MTRDTPYEPPTPPTSGSYVEIPEIDPMTTRPADVPPPGSASDDAPPANAVEHLLRVAERLGRELAATQQALRQLAGQLAAVDPNAILPPIPDSTPAAPSPAAPAEGVGAAGAAPAAAGPGDHDPVAEPPRHRASNIPRRRADHVALPPIDPLQAAAAAAPAPGSTPSPWAYPPPYAPAADPYGVPYPGPAAPAPEPAAPATPPVTPRPAFPPAGAAAPFPPAAEPAAPRDPAPYPFPAPAPPTPAAAPTSPSWPAAVPQSGGFDDEPEPFGHNARTRHVASLAEVPLLSAGEVEAMIGPVFSLDELDDLDARIRALHGVEDLAVTAFEGSDVLLTITLERPLPLAGMLRTELGRPVASCRLVEGRIVVQLETEAA